MQAILSVFFIGWCLVFFIGFIVVCLLWLSLFTLDSSDYLSLSEILELEDLVASVCVTLYCVFSCLKAADL